MSKPEIFCRYDEIKDPASLKPHPRNPNRHPDSQLEKLAVVIQGNGWRQPITISRRSGYVIKGHGRLQAAIKAGLTEVPVEYQDYATEALEYSDMVADNKLAELSEIDDAAITQIVEELKATGADISLTGIDLDIDIDEMDVQQVLDRMDQEAEYKAAAVSKATAAREKFNEIMDRLQEEHPEKLSNAICVIVPKGRGSAKDCIIIQDEACRDIVEELKRYADEGAPSPLDKLLSGVISYAPDANAD